MARSVKVTLEADPAKFTTGLEPCKRSVEDFKGTLTRLDAAIKTLPDVKVTAETTDAELKLAAVREELKGLAHDGATIDVHLAAAQVARIRAELAALTSGEGTSLAVHLSASKTAVELERLAKTLPPVAERVGEKVSASLFGRLRAGAVSGFKALDGAVMDGLSKLPGKIGSMLAGLPWQMIVPIAVIVAALAGPISAALSAAIGLGGVAGGVVLAFHDPAIKKASKDLLSTITSGLQDAAHPFVEPLLKGIAILRDGFKQSLPVIQGMFTQLADTVPGLARGFSGFLSGLTSGFADAAIRAKPLLDIFATRLPELGRVVGNLFKEIGSDSIRSSEGLNMLFNYIRTGIKELGLFIQALEMVGQALNFVVKWTSWALTLGQAQVDFAKGTTLLAKSLATVADTASGVNPALALTSDEIGKLTTQVTKLTPSLDTMAGAMTDAVFKSMMGMDQAAIAVAKSLTTVTETLKKNKRELDIHKAAGQADREAILGAVEANIRQYDAMIQAGIGADDATKAYEANTRALESQLRKAGLTKQEIDGLIGKYRNVPKNVNTLMAIQGLTDAINGLADLIRKLNGLDGRNVKSYVTTYYTSKFGGSGPAANKPMPNEFGGIQHFALGGAFTAGSAGIVSGGGPYAMFGEPGTGASTEGFLPRSGISRMRAGGLLSEMAGWYGYGVADYSRVAGGGGAGSTTLNLAATFVLPSGEVVHRQLVRYALDTNRTPSELFPASSR